MEQCVVPNCDCDCDCDCAGADGAVRSPQLLPRVGPPVGAGVVPAGAGDAAGAPEGPLPNLHALRGPQGRMVGLGAAIKPLIGPFTTGDFNSPPEFFVQARKAPEAKTARLT
eukprot:1059168-Pyramimonas_sp.AAC.2